MADESKPETEDSFVGRKVGGYSITRRVGQGGMGVVYEARHEKLGQRAAVKVLHKEMSADQKVLQRFFNEAKAISVAQHSGIVKIFDFGQLDDGIAYILMEFLEGETLLSRLDRSHHDATPLPLPLVIELSRQLAEALALIHHKGIVHRDLKPENIFIVPDPLAPAGERVKLLDFGIAKFLDGPVRKTTVGMILGTPLYMSPEQCEGSEDLDAKVDVYALGVMLYEMIAGRLPFTADTAGALMRQHMFKDPPPLSEQVIELPAELDDLVHQMLAKQSAQRPAMTEVAALLDQLAPRGKGGRDAPSIPGLSGTSLRRRQIRISQAPAAADPLAQTMGGPSDGVAMTLAGPAASSGAVGLATTLAARESERPAIAVTDELSLPQAKSGAIPLSSQSEPVVRGELAKQSRRSLEAVPPASTLLAETAPRRRPLLAAVGLLAALLCLGGLGLKLRPGKVAAEDRSPSATVDSKSGAAGPPSGNPATANFPAGATGPTLHVTDDGKGGAGVSDDGETGDGVKGSDGKKKKRSKSGPKRRPGEESTAKGQPTSSGKHPGGGEPDVWR